MYELIVIGGGPAGLAAACEAYDKGLRRILIIERDKELGGILNQCIHNGFGLHHFKQELTGPEYAERFVEMLSDTEVEVKLDTMVLNITKEKEVHVMNAAEGYQILRTKSVVLAMGCRERTRGAISIPGDRPAGVFTAGAAQRFVNMEGYMVGRKVLILGSGDIGLIMARRMTLEGAKVVACVELMPYSNGLTRNIVQCLEDYHIPLYLSHTIIDIEGKERVEKVVIAKVDQDRKPIPGTEITFDCDTILLSVGLIPENELTRKAGIAIDNRTNGAVVYENMETSIPGVFACGNVVHVHDLVDFVTAESQRAGASAAAYVLQQKAQEAEEAEEAEEAQEAQHTQQEQVLLVANGEGITYTVPQKIRVDHMEKPVDLFFRVNRVIKDSTIVVKAEDTPIASFKRKHVAPGEMEHILLPANLLEKAKNMKITVSIKEGA